MANSKPVAKAASSVTAEFDLVTDQLRQTLLLLEERTEKRAREMETVAQVSAEISQNLDLDTLLVDVSNTVKERFDLYHAHIYLVDGAMLTLAAGAGEAGQAMTAEKRSIPLNTPQSIVARAARDHQAVIVNDTVKEADFLPHPLLPNTKSEMAVPLIVGGTVVGVLDMQADRVGHFTDEDVRVKTTLAAQVAIAIENARSFDRTEKALAETETLYAASEAVNKSETLQQILDAIIAHTSIQKMHRSNIQLFDFPWVDETPNYLEVSAVWESTGDAPLEPLGTRYEVATFPVIQTISRSEPTIFADAAVDERFDPAARDVLINTLGMRGFATFPLTVGNQWIGYVTCQSATTIMLTDEELRQINTTVDQAAVKIQSIRLFNQTRTALRELENFQMALDQSAIVAMTDVAGKITYVNDKFCDISKYSREELLGQDHRIINSGHHSKEFIRDLWVTIANGNIWRGEICNRAKDGSLYWVDTTIVPQLNDEGKPDKYIAIRYEITERVKKEQQIRLYADVMENTPVGLYVWQLEDENDPQSLRLLAANEASYQATGARPENVVGHLMRDTFKPLMETPIPGIYANIALNGEYVDLGEVEFQGEDDSEPGIYSVKAFPLPNHSTGVSFENITERKRQEEQIIRRARELETVTNVSTQIATSLELDTLLESLVNQTRDNFQRYYVQVYLLDESGQELVLAAGSGEIGRQLVAEDHHIPLDRANSLVAQAARSEEVIYVNDVSREPNFLPNRLLPDTRAEMVVPIHLNHELIGVLDIQDDKVNPFSDLEVQTKTILANQIAVAINNARLYEVTQRRALEMQIVSQVSAEAASNLDINSLLFSVSNLVKERFGLYHAHIYLLDSAGENLVLTAGAGEAGRFMSEEKRTIPLDTPKSIVARAARERSGVIVDNVTKDLNFLPNPLLPDTKSEMAVPMMIAGRVIGVMDVQSEQYNRFTENDILIQTTLSAQIAVAIENARAYEETERARQEVERIFNSSLDMIGTANFEGYFTNLNPAWEKTLGFTNAELMAEPYINRIHPDDIAMTLKEAEKLSQGINTFSFTNRYLAKDGSYHWIQWNAAADMPNGQIHFVARDITTERAQEEALATSQLRLSQAVSIAKIGYWECDLLTGMFTFTDEFYSIFATSAEAEGGYQMSAEEYSRRFVHPADGNIVADEIGKSIAAKDPSYSPVLEHRIIRADGSEGWISVRFSIELNEENVAVRSRGANQDITERKQQEAVLALSQTRLSEAVSIAKLGYWEYDVPSGLFTFTDDLYATLRTTAEAEGGYQMSAEAYAQKFVHPDDAQMVGISIGKALSTTDPNYSVELEHRIIRADGTEGWIDVRFSVQMGEDGKVIGWRGANQDITERKQQEAALALSQDRLNEAVRIAKLGYWEFDVASGLFTFSDDLYTLLGTTAEAEGGYHMTAETYAQKFVHPEDAPLVGIEIGKILQTTDPNYGAEIEHRFFRADGSEGWVNVRSRVRMNEEGKVIGWHGANQDITERKKAEEAVRQQSTIIETSSDFIALTSMDGVIEYLNPGGARMMGFASQEEAVGTLIPNYHTPEDGELVLTVGVPTVLREGMWRSENRLLTRSGDLITVEQTLFVVRDENGTPRNIATIMSDITERKQQEEAIRSQAAIINASPSFIGTASLDGISTYLNPTALDMLAFDSEAEAANISISELQPAEYTEMLLREALPTAMKTGAWRGENLLLTRKGDLIPVDQSIFVIRDEKGEPSALATIINDIRERKQQEEALKVGEERYRSLTTATAQIIWNTDAAGSVYDMPMWREYTGQTQPEVEGWGWLSAVHPEDRERTAGIWQHCVDTRSLYEVEYRIRRHDGEYRHFAVRGVPIIDAATDTLREWVGTCTDIHEQKLAQEEREVLFDIANKLNAAQTYEDVFNAPLDYLKSLGASTISLGLIENDPNGKPAWLEISAEWTRSADTMSAPVGSRFYLPDFDFAQLWIANPHHVRMIEDMNTDPQVDEITRQTYKHLNTNAAIIIPFYQAGRWTALYNMNWNEPVRFTEQQKRIFEAIRQQAGSVIDIIRASSEIARRAREMETVAQVSTAASSILDLSVLLREVSDLTKASFDLYHAHIYLLDDEGENLVLAAGAGEAGRIMQERQHSIALDHPNSLVAGSARSREGVIVNDVTANPDFLPNPLLPNTKSEMAIPMVVGDKLVGVLDVQSDKLNRFTDEDVLIQTTLGKQIAVAVENARAYQQTQAAFASIETLYGGSEAVNRTQTLQDVLDAIIQHTAIKSMHRSNIQLFNFAWVNKQPDYLEVSAVWESTGGDPLEPIGTRYEVETFPVVKTISRDIPTIFADAGEDERFDPAAREVLINQLGMRGFAVFPLTVGEEWIGYITCQSPTRIELTDEELRQINALVGQAAVKVQTIRAYQEQLQAAERLREVDRLKSEFLANMSHELRTPLNSIIGYSEVLLDGIDGELTEDAVEDVKAIHGSGQHLLNIINDILDLAKIEAGKMNIDRQQMDLGTFVKEIVNTAEILVKNKPVTLELIQDEVVPPIYADAVRLRQIIWNIISNAVKFTEQGSVTVRVERDGEMGVVRVTDTGIGIQADHLNSVFDQFRQVDGSSTRRAGGTGLGLTITRQLVQMHGGSIHVESEYGEGSTFWFTLPLYNTEKVRS